MKHLLIALVMLSIALTAAAETTCAEIDANGVVLRVIVASSPDWCASRLGGTWICTTGKRYPGAGWKWDGEDFIPPQPYPSWTWDGSQWMAPVPMPSEGVWTWDGAGQGWIEAEE
jgi:hypothetical protein